MQELEAQATMQYEQTLEVEMQEAEMQAAMQEHEDQMVS